MKIQKFNRLVERLNRHQVTIVDFKPLEDRSTKVRLYDNVDGEFTDFSVIYRQDETYSYELMVIDESGITSVERKDLSEDMHQVFIEALIDEALYNYQVLESTSENINENQFKIDTILELDHFVKTIRCGVTVFTALHTGLSECVFNSKIAKQIKLELEPDLINQAVRFQYKDFNIESDDKLTAPSMVIESNDIFLSIYFKRKERIAEFLL